MKKIKNLFFKIISLPTRMLFMIKHYSIGKNVQINGNVSVCGTGFVTLENGVVINSSHRANPSGGVKSTFFVLKDARLQIGRNTGISNTTICCTNEVKIGNYVTIGADCYIYDTDFHPLDYKDRRDKTANIKTKSIVIEDDAFIGAHTIILKGSYIGKRSIIGAGSVVSGYIPSDEVWVGNPCRFVRKIDARE